MANSISITDQDITPDEVQLDISSWKEVRCTVRDDQLTLAGARSIYDRIRLEGYAIANKIDQDICSAYAKAAGVELQMVND